VDSSGHPSYSAWWELVPAPAITIANMTVSAGDRIHASVSQAAPGTWTIALNDVTRRETFSTTVPYPSTQSTAEWIEETPLTIGSGGTGQASLPNLGRSVFGNATVNGVSAHLATGEQVQLVDSSGKVIGAPSAPDAEAGGFADCAWTTRCAIPAASRTTIHKSSTTARHRHRKSTHRRHRKKHAHPRKHSRGHKR
jgi:hypothetical protein